MPVTASRLTLILSAVVAIIVVGLGIMACGGDDDDEGGGGTLTIGGWGGTINEATQQAYLDPFAAEGGPEARFVDAPGTQLAQVLAQAERGEIEWDALDSVAGDAAFVLNDEGLLQPLPDDLRETLISDLGEERVTDFGFAHGTVANVIVCNMDRMDSCPRNMEEFYDTEQFPQDRMFGGIGPAMALTTAQVASGVPASETRTTPIDLDEVFGLLEELKSDIKVFWESGDQMEQVMQSGAVDMGIIWSSRATKLVNDGMNLEIVWDGAAYEASYWTVLEDAPNAEAGFDLLEWIATHPEAQAQWAQTAEASIPHPEGIEALPEETARSIPDFEANFERLAIPNFEWYAQNDDEVNSRYEEFVRG